MKAEYSVSNRMVGDCEPFELTLACQPGFDKVGFHVTTWVERIREQRPSHGSVPSTHPAKFMSSTDKFIRLLRIDAKGYRHQYWAVLRVRFDDNLWTCSVQGVWQTTWGMVQSGAASKRVPARDGKPSQQCAGGKAQCRRGVRTFCQCTPKRATNRQSTLEHHLIEPKSTCLDPGRHR